MKLFIVSGDHSGNVHGANVVQSLRALMPDIQVSGIGGVEMKEAGVQLLQDQSQMGRVGFGSVTGIPYHFQLGQKILAALKTNPPDAVLLIDYGGFNLWLAPKLKKMGLRVFYFIPPQVWASRKGRIKKIKATCERVFCIFPFEEALYQAENIPVTYVGHPLTGKLPPKASKEDFCNRHGLDPDLKLLALFPGSRKSEMGFHLDIILNALPLIQKGLGDSSRCQFVMALPSSLSEHWLQKFLYPKLNLISAQHPTLKIIGVKQENHALLSIADAAVIKSGTSTLEAALYKTPMVIVYKVHRLFFELALRLCYLPCLGLPNILTSVNNPPFPELLQTQFTSENIAQQVLPLFNPQSESYQKQHLAFEAIQSQFGGENATQRVAEELAKLMHV